MRVCTFRIFMIAWFMVYIFSTPAFKNKKMNIDFKTTHNLPFMVAEYPCLFLESGELPWISFKVGTCEGLWRVLPGAYQILAPINHKKGNGHMDDVLEWFEYSCKRDGYDLVILELMNSAFEKHLIEKRGFKKFKYNSLIKKFKNG